jgi:hypothetical protein
MKPREALIRLRDLGRSYEAILVVDGERVAASGSCPCEAVHQLVTEHVGPFAEAMDEGLREVDATLSLGDWVTEPGGELITLLCSVMREPDRIPPGEEGQRIELSELSPQVRELVHWVLEQWRDARGLGS